MADINRIGIALVATMLACVSQASWYWPFDSEDDDGDPKKAPPRLSELMEPASQLIDEASDCAATGTVKIAVDKYRAALGKLEEIEAANPERAKLPEFATLRNKRAYVSAAIDSLLLGQIKDNARAVAVSDTDDLERQLIAEYADKGRSSALAKDFKSVAKCAEKIRGIAPRAFPKAIAHSVEAFSCCVRRDVEGTCDAMEKTASVLRGCDVLVIEDAAVLTNALHAIYKQALEIPREAVREGRAAEDGCRRLQIAWESGSVTNFTEYTSNVHSNTMLAVDRTRNLAGMYAFPESVALSECAARLEPGVWTVTSNHTFKVDGDALSAFASALSRFSPAEERYEPVRTSYESVRRQLLPIIPSAMSWNALSNPAPRMSYADLRKRAMKCIEQGDFADAGHVLGEMLKEKPNSPAALNLKAMMESRQGKFKDAEQTLAQCIAANPDSYFAYYNMCELMLRIGKRKSAWQYYKDGRERKGPKDPALEEGLR